MRIEDNHDVAVLTKLNELAERRGLKPYHFIAVVRRKGDGNVSLDFEVPTQGNLLREERFYKMVEDIGIGLGGDGLELIGATSAVIDALDNAIKMSPRSRLR